MNAPRLQCAGCHATPLAAGTYVHLRLSGGTGVVLCRDQRFTTAERPRETCVARFIAQVAEAAAGGAS
jgi:hypothetical protein